MDDWDKIKKEILKDPEVKKYYDDMEVEYRMISDLIRLRKAEKINQEQLAKRMAKALDRKLEIRFV